MLARLRLLAAATVALEAVGCGASTPTSSEEADFIAPEEACERDDECVITDYPGCCECCGCATPYAIRADALERQRSECASQDCTARHEEQECAIVECAGCPLTEETFRAVCNQGRCTRTP